MLCVRKFVYNLMAALSLTMIPACTSFEIVNHTEEFNHATANLNLDLLLLNAVRSSKDYPLQFTRISSYDGSGSRNGSLQAKIPFGPGVLSPVYNADPTINLNTGLSKLTLMDLNTQEAQSALKEQLKDNDYRYYKLLAGNRRGDIVETLLIEHFRLEAKIFASIVINGNRLCQFRDGNIANQDWCFGIRDFQHKCDDKKNISTLIERYAGRVVLNKKDKNQHPIYVISNKLNSKCSYLAFRAFISYLLLAEWITYPVEIYSKNAKKKEAILKSSFRKEIMESINEKKCKNERETGEICFDIIFRSPERVVRYLGEMIALQNFNKDKFVPYLIVRENVVFDFFRVERGSSLKGHSVKVTDPEGEIFYVPKAEHGQETRHRTLEVLGFVTELINGAVSAKSLPQVNSITLQTSP